MMHRLLSAMLFAATSAAALAQPVIFHDDFSDPDRTAYLWGNQRGNWAVSGGHYGATQPSNQPPTISTAPYTLRDLDLECDLVAADDGGIWLHADAAGLNGVLLVFARSSVYWHNMVGGNAGGIINQAPGIFAAGQTLHIRATVVGSTYSAYVNGTLVTSYTNPSYPAGRVGLYDFRAGTHDYDNVVLRGVCDGGDCCAIAYAAPGAAVVCPGASQVYLADASGTGPFTYRWQVQTQSPPGLWVDAPEGEYAPMHLTFSGTQSPACTVTSASSQGGALFPSQQVRCVVTNTCTPAPSPGATFVVLACCPDMNVDGNVDQDDVAYLINVIGGGPNPTGIDPDFNHDGNADQDDVSALINVVAGGPCP